MKNLLKIIYENTLAPFVYTLFSPVGVMIWIMIVISVIIIFIIALFA